MNILITGATSGVGRYVAERLGARGDHVLAHGRDEAKLKALGSDVTPLRADLASLDAVRELAASVEAAVPRLDVLVNNAGLGFGEPGAARPLSPDGNELTWAVNYLAPVLLTRELLPLLTSSAPSKIVNVGSIGQEPIDFDDLRMDRGQFNGLTAYRRSKLALAAWTFELADELDGTGVTATCIHPATFMDTAMVRQAGITPLSTVEDGGDAVLRLITEEAGTGLFFDGTRATRAHADAYDPSVRRRLREATEVALD